MLFKCSIAFDMGMKNQALTPGPGPSSGPGPLT